MLRATIQYVRSPEFTAREFGPIVADANGEVVLFWHQTFLKQHFTVSGAEKYSYQKRAGEGEPEFIPSRKHPDRTIKNPHYWWRKKHAGKGIDPLVYSGDLKRIALSRIEVKASKNRATGTFPGIPRYAYQYRPRQPDKSDELVRVVEDEVQAMAHVHERAIVEHIERIRESRTVEAA